MRIKRQCNNLILLASVANQVLASLAPQHRLSHPHSNIHTSILSQITRIRGGEGEGSSTPPPETTYNQYAAQNQQPQQQMANPNFQQPPSTTTNDPMYEYRETVEDRIDAWRKQQLNMQQTQSAAEAASVVDDQGRFRLFTTVSRVSVSLFFFILMWRTVHHYELADATFASRTHNNTGLRASLLRIIIVTPLVVLFLGEMMGAILGVTGGGSNASHTTKKRLKGILNLHKAVELIMMFYNVIRLAIWPSQYVMREVYIGRTISNFFFLMQAQLYTKLSWDEIAKSTMDGGYATESYYDDYTPDLANYYDGQSNSWTPPTESESTQSGEYYRQGDAPPSTQYDQQQNYGENSSEWGSQQ